MTEHPQPAALIDFWREVGPERWFKADANLDAACRRFLPAHEAAARGDLDAWEATSEGALALTLLLDQFPRNLFRGSARAYATDTRALALAGRAVDRRLDAAVEPSLRRFLYLPFMHAESLDAQEHSLRLYEALGDAQALTFARHHHEVVRRFGRFPHRNAVLGRPSSPGEKAFLREDAFRG